MRWRSTSITESTSATLPVRATPYALHCTDPEAEGFVLDDRTHTSVSGSTFECHFPSKTESPSNLLIDNVKQFAHSVFGRAAAVLPGLGLIHPACSSTTSSSSTQFSSAVGAMKTITQIHRLLAETKESSSSPDLKHVAAEASVPEAQERTSFAGQRKLSEAEPHLTPRRSHKAENIVLDASQSGQLMEHTELPHTLHSRAVVDAHSTSPNSEDSNTGYPS